MKAKENQTSALTNTRRKNPDDWNAVFYNKKVLWGGLSSKTTYYVFFAVLILVAIIYYL
ncbi:MULTISPECIES: hypothetical protein [Pedobacter]|nr:MULTISPECIES: hypothetical protein [Pedobacter]MBB5437996.1 hypothetical protein [Pedobacter sp. AK017]